MKEYFVVFTQGNHWIAWLLKVNFSHIYVLCRDDYNWMIINPARKFLQVGIVAAKASDDVLTLAAKPGDSVIRIVFGERDSMTRFRLWGLMNCVSYTKYILGMPLFCLTPFGLYKRLLNFRTDEYARDGIISIELIKGERDYGTRHALE